MEGKEAMLLLLQGELICQVSSSIIYKIQDNSLRYSTDNGKSWAASAQSIRNWLGFTDYEVYLEI